MNYLTHSEIDENSIIMIEFKNEKKEPYFVNHKNIGVISGATMLLGFTLLELLKKPELYPCSNNGMTDRFYIENDETKGYHKGVKGYRKLDQKEKDEWSQKLSSIKRLNPLMEVILKN